MEKRDTLGGRIQAGRKAAGLSQEALGERLGVSRQAVSKWEADAAVPELENLIAMSRIFGVTIGALLGVEPPAGGSVAPGENGPEDGAPDAAAEAVPTPTHELTDRELAAAEAIAEKYLAVQSRRAAGGRSPREQPASYWSWGFFWAACCCGASCKAPSGSWRRLSMP